MLEVLKADLAAVIKSIEEMAVKLQVTLGQRQGLEHAISKLEAAAPIVEAIDPADIVLQPNACVDAVQVTALPVP